MNQADYTHTVQLNESSPTRGKIQIKRNKGHLCRSIDTPGGVKCVLYVCVCVGGGGVKLMKRSYPFSYVS